MRIGSGRAPALKEGGTRKGTVDEVINFVRSEGFDYLKDEVRDKAIKRSAVWCAARWSAAEGLVVTVEIALGALSVVGWIALAASVLELLIVLQKPVEKPMSRRESILLQVKAWFYGQQMMEEAAEKAAQDRKAEKESLSKPLRFEVTPAVRATTKVGP